MPTISKILLAAAGSLAIAGAATAADRKSPDLRVLKLVLPDGSVQHVQYRDNIAPRLVFVPVRTSAPMALHDADLFRPFAMLDRIAAQMNRQFELMMRQAAALSARVPATNGGLSLAATRSLPPGTISYSFTSTSTASGTCSRSVQVTSLGPDQAPKVVSQSTGDCGTAPSPAAKPKTDLRDTI